VVRSQRLAAGKHLNSKAGRASESKSKRKQLTSFFGKRYNLRSTWRIKVRLSDS